MERKKFNRGTVNGGIVRIVISAVAVFVAIIVMSSAIKNWDPESITGGVFMCVIASIMIFASIFFVADGIRMILDGRKSFEVSRKGHSEVGRILDLTATEVTETQNGCVSHYTIYNLKFEYTDDNGNLCESQEQISEKVFSQLQENGLVPILVYKERAIFDRKKFESDNSQKTDNTQSK